MEQIPPLLNNFRLMAKIGPTCFFALTNIFGADKSHIPIANSTLEFDGKYLFATRYERQCPVFDVIHCRYSSLEQFEFRNQSEAPEKNPTLDEKRSIDFGKT